MIFWDWREFTVGNVWEVATGCQGGGRAGDLADCSAASGGRRGCWAGRAGRQLLQQGRGRLGEDSRDLVEGPRAPGGTVTGRYSRVPGLGTAAARCWRPSRGSASSTWSAGSGTRSWPGSRSGWGSAPGWAAHRLRDIWWFWTCSPGWPTARTWRLSGLASASRLGLQTSSSSGESHRPDPRDSRTAERGDSRHRQNPRRQQSAQILLKYKEKSVKHVPGILVSEQNSSCIISYTSMVLNKIQYKNEHIYHLSLTKIWIQTQKWESRGKFKST